MTSTRSAAGSNSRTSASLSTSMLNSALDEIPDREPDIGRAFRQPPHEPREPIGAVGDQDACAIAGAPEPDQLRPLDAVEHLELVFVLPYPGRRREFRNAADQIS